MATAEETRRAAVDAVTAKRRELEAQGLTPKKIQANKELKSLQQNLEKAKAGVGLLTTKESLAILNKGLGEKATDTRLASAATKKREALPKSLSEQVFNLSNPPSITPPPGYRWIKGTGQYAKWNLEASNEARERDNVSSIQDTFGGGQLPWTFDESTNSFVFKPTQFTPQSTIEQFLSGIKNQNVGIQSNLPIGTKARLPTVSQRTDGGARPIVSNSNYTFSPSPVVTTQQTTQQITQQTTPISNQDARGARDLARLLAYEYGLGDDFFATIESLIIEDLSEASIMLALRGSDSYKKRFSANATRVSKGLPALSEAEYLNMEKLYRDTLREAGLPSQLFDNQDDFTNYIANDISYNEFQGRVSLAQRASQAADPAIKAQLKERYNIDESGLVAYFLNPEKTKPFLQRQYNVAQTAAALQQAGFGTAQAEELTGSVLGGATDTTLDYKELTQAAQSAGVLRPLSQEVLGGEGGSVSEQQLLRGVVAGDVTAQVQLEREQRRRLAEFQAGGGYAEGQQGVTGLRRAGR